MMRRREVVLLLGAGAVAWPLVTRAQQTGELRRIGVLMGIGNDPEAERRVIAFRRRLQELGWTEGRNIRIDARFAASDAEQYPALAKELVAMRPEVLVGHSTPVTAALRRETESIPIIFVGLPDPIGSGFVKSYAHPGGNLTGFASYSPAALKWVELLKQVAPKIVRIAIVFGTESVPKLRSIVSDASALGVQATAAPVRDQAEIESAIKTFAVEPNGGLIVLPTNFTTVHRDLIIALAARYRLPAIFPRRFFVAAGGLMSYGDDDIDLYQRAASYVDRILKGAKPGDLPVQEPTKFELVVNLETAKALGLTIPPSLLARADEVIE